jgi:putative chitinase
MRFTKDSAAKCARQPEKIANIAYANRYGNGDEISGDGWRYRGRGVMQITFKENYKACGVALGLDLIKFPELLEQPLNIFRSAGWYWTTRKLNDLADKGDFLAITKIINGGTLGIEDRTNYYNRAKLALK